MVWAVLLPWYICHVWDHLITLFLIILYARLYVWMGELPTNGTYIYNWYSHKRWTWWMVTWLYLLSLLPLSYLLDTGLEPLQLHNYTAASNPVSQATTLLDEIPNFSLADLFWGASPLFQQVSKTLLDRWLSCVPSGLSNRPLFCCFLLCGSSPASTRRAQTGAVFIAPKQILRAQAWKTSSALTTQILLLIISPCSHNLFLPGLADTHTYFIDIHSHLTRH